MNPDYVGACASGYYREIKIWDTNINYGCQYIF